jgi:hypothetical protein
MPFSYGPAPSFGQTGAAPTAGVAQAPTMGRNAVGGLLSRTDAAGNPWPPPPPGAPPMTSAAGSGMVAGPAPSGGGIHTGAASSLGLSGGAGSQMPRLPPAQAMPTYGGPLPVMPSAQAPGSGPSPQSVEQAALAGGGDASRTQDFISALRAVGAGSNDTQLNVGTPAPTSTPQLLGAPAAWTGNAGTTSYAQAPAAPPVGQSVLQSLGPQAPAPAPAGGSGPSNGMPSWYKGGDLSGGGPSNFNGQLPSNFGQPAPGDAWEKQSATMQRPFPGGAQMASLARPAAGAGAQFPMQRPQQAQGSPAPSQQPPQRPPPQGAGMAPQQRPGGAPGLMQRPPSPAPPRPNLGAQGMLGANAMMSDERAKIGIRDGARAARSLLELIALEAE